MTSLAPAWGIYPGYFGYNAYSAIPAPFFPNIVPQTQPLFAYSFVTPHGADSAATITPAVAAQSIYTAPDDTFRGYSIQTEYEGGAKSEVVFVTGPQANQILQKSVDLFRQVVPAELGQITGRSLNGVNATNTTDTPATAHASPATAPGPIASMYHVQLYPADTTPFLGPVTPLQNLVSSFAYSITNDIANTLKEAAKDGAENEGEAQESMIHEVGATVTASPSNATKESSSETSSTTTTTAAATTTTATTTTESASSSSSTTTTSAPPTTTAESTTTGPSPSEEKNEVAESNTAASSSEEIMETTSS